MANNVINAAFSSSTITYTKPVYQYDYGMILKFSGIELPQAYEVHFSNTEFCGESISQIGDESGVTIPDEMFLSGAPIYAWTFLHTGEDDGETVYKTVISINKRAQPSDIEPTPVQRDVITQAIAALNTAVEQTAADVVAAGESAEAAAGSAEAAGQAKDDAVEAKDKAVEAKNAAETAQGKAEDAQRAAEQAAGSVLGLTADASVDANVGTPSVEVEVTTESDHKNMSFAFHNLKGVQGDPGDTGVGISSVILNADYTLTITLTNGASYTTTSIRGEVGATPNLTIGTVSTLPEGSQATASITGTDEEPVLNLGIPVGDTGATGNGIASIAKTGTVGLVDTYTITYTNGTTSTFEVTNGQDGEVSEEQLETALIDKADVITSTASGEIVTIADGGNDLPVVDLSVSLLPIQSGSGDPSPTNIRPISGWTGVEVYQRGRNLVNWGSVLSDYKSYRGIEYSYSNGVVSLTGTSSNVYAIALDVGTGQPYYTNLSLSNKIKLPKGSYICNFPVLYGTNVGGSYSASGNAKADANTVFTLSEGGYITPFYAGGSGSSPNVNKRICLSFASESIPSVPDLYNGQTYPITWQTEAGTVYGGSLDVTTGVLTVDTGFASFTGDDAWSVGTLYEKSVFQLSRPSQIPNKAYFLSNYITYSNTLSGSGKDNMGYFGSSYFNVYCPSVPDLTTWTAMLSTTPMQIAYELATPLTFQLSENQIATFLGTNNFWSNGNGELSLEYRADTKLYIQQLTKPSEDDMVANANIASGRFFMVGNRLMLSTTAIAQGEQIVVGTNCSELSLADGLNLLNS